MELHTAGKSQFLQQGWRVKVESGVCLSPLQGIWARSRQIYCSPICSRPQAIRFGQMSSHPLRGNERFWSHWYVRSLLSRSYQCVLPRNIVSKKTIIVYCISQSIEILATSWNEAIHVGDGCSVFPAHIPRQNQMRPMSARFSLGQHSTHCHSSKLCSIEFRIQTQMKQNHAPGDLREPRSPDFQSF
jgi:hypothetical protein